MDYNQYVREQFKSKDSLLYIIDCHKEIKTEKLKMFLDELRKYLEHSPELKDLLSNGDLEIQDVYNDSKRSSRHFYYEHRSWPFVNLLTKFEIKDVRLSIRFEIGDDDGLCYVGVIVHSSDLINQIKISEIKDEYIKKYIQSISLPTSKRQGAPRQKGWWRYRDEITFNHNSIDFTYLNNSYLELFNDETGEKNRVKVYQNVVEKVVMIYDKLKQNDVFFNNGLN